jgi:nucleoside-diphosphate-sugar epimerase
MTERDVLVVGGSGMLRPAVHRLLEERSRVVVVARRPERAASGTARDERLIPVAADWAKPRQLVDRVVEARGHEPFGEAILWVHSPSGDALHPELHATLVDDAVVVHLWGSARRDPLRGPGVRDAYAPPRRYRRVVLGFADGPGGTRWLTDEEISAGAVRALADPDPVQIVGRVEPWSDRP